MKRALFTLAVIAATSVAMNVVLVYELVRTARDVTRARQAHLETLRHDAFLDELRADARARERERHERTVP